MYAIANFYRFVGLTRLDELKSRIDAIASDAGLVGTVLLAPEGINGGFAGSDRSIVADVVRRLSEITPALADLEPKWTSGISLPYKWLEVKVKKSIVTFTDNQDPDIEAIQRAPRLTPGEYDELMVTRGREVIVVDTRNDYEFQYGHFENAIDLGIKKFRDFPAAFEERFGDQKDKTFVFFCTGGIRCEKAVPWALERGFKSVFQIDGGIIKYLEHQQDSEAIPTAAPRASRWQGNCFVFDQRWAVDDRLSETSHMPPTNTAQPGG